MPHNEPPNNNFPPNINPNLYALSTYIIGMVIIDDLNVSEQNTIGNWLMLLGQFIITNAGQQALIESRIEKNNINILFFKKSKRLKKNCKIFKMTQINSYLESESFFHLCDRKLYNLD